MELDFSNYLIINSETNDLVDLNCISILGNKIIEDKILKSYTFNLNSDSIIEPTASVTFTHDDYHILIAFYQKKLNKSSQFKSIITKSDPHLNEIILQLEEKNYTHKETDSLILYFILDRLDNISTDKEQILIIELIIQITLSLNDQHFLDMILNHKKFILFEEILLLIFNKKNLHIDFVINLYTMLILGNFTYNRNNLISLFEILRIKLTSYIKSADKEKILVFLSMIFTKSKDILFDLKFKNTSIYERLILTLVEIRGNLDEDTNDLNNKNAFEDINNDNYQEIEDNFVIILIDNLINLLTKT